MRGEKLENLFDESLSHFHPAAKIQIAVSLGQNRQSIPETDIILANSWLMRERLPSALIWSARLRRLAFEVAIVIGSKLMLREHRVCYHRHHLFAMVGDYPRIDSRIQRNRISEMITVIRTVGCMQIDSQMRVPAVK